MTRPLFLLLLVVALTVGTRSFLPDEARVTGSGAALAFGFLLIVAVQVAQICRVLKLPMLTGYLLCGALFGPDVLGFLTPAMVADLTLVKHVAVGWIAFLAGCELNLSRLRARLRSVAAFAGFGLAAEILLLFPLFLWMTRWLPFAQDLASAERVAVALVCAVALAALSPAVVIGILTETRAAGPLAELALSVVVAADLVIVLAFSFTEWGVQAATGGSGGPIFGKLAVHIFGSLAVGAGVGAVLALYIRRIGRRVGLFTFVIFFVAAEAGSAVHVDPLLVGLASGLFLENVSPVGGHEAIRHTQAATLPTFAIFFSVVGAEAHLKEFVAVAGFAIAAVAVRATALFAGARVAARFANVDPRVARLAPQGMLPQTGIAIALAHLVATAFPRWGPGASTLLLGAIVVNEMIGPVLFRNSLSWAGEIGRRPARAPARAPAVEPAVDEVRFPAVGASETAAPHAGRAGKAPRAGAQRLRARRV